MQRPNNICPFPQTFPPELPYSIWTQSRASRHSRTPSYLDRVGDRCSTFLMIIATCLRHAVTGSLDGKLIVWDCWTGNKIQVNVALLYTVQLTTKIHFLGISRLETLLVQRCNGITAGLGYLEINVICPCNANLPIGWLTSVHTMD